MKFTQAEQKAYENMIKCGMTPAEAKQVIADDREIDKGKKLFELTDEQKANSKKARQADRKISDKPIKKERKVDNSKRELIRLLVSALNTKSAITDIEVSNVEREINFNFFGREFKIVLSAPRPPKNS